MATKKATSARKSARGAAAEASEDFYKRLREKITAWSDRNEIKPAYREYLLALPDLFHLVARLVLDRRVDAVSRTLLGVALAYALSPFDLLPDFLGPLGFVDDLLVIALVLETVLLRVSRAIVESHWAGKANLVELVRKVHEAADGWIGRGMYLRIRQYLAEHGIGTPVDQSAARAASAPKRAAAARRKPLRRSVTPAKKAKATPTAKRKTPAKPAGKAPAPKRGTASPKRKAAAPNPKGPKR